MHELHLARAMILEKLGRLPAALAAYGDALQVAERPARAAVLTARGALYRRLGEPALAAMDFAAAANP